MEAKLFFGHTVELICICYFKDLHQVNVTVTTLAQRVSTKEDTPDVN